jgi:hypothetical protein
VGWDVNAHVHVHVHAKGTAMDVAQNKHARQQFREIGCHAQIVSWMKY